MTDVQRQPFSGHPSVQPGAIAMLFVLAWMVVVGVVWRQAGSRESVRQPSQTVDPTPFAAQLPPAIEITAGVSAEEVGRQLEALGLDTFEATTALIADPTALSLPQELEAVESLDGYLAPGSYLITPTTDARVLLERMAAAFVDQLDSRVLAGMDSHDLTLADTVRIAGLAQQAASSTSELPVAAGVLHNQQSLPRGPVGTVGSAALLAATHPMQTDAQTFHTDRDGALRLGPPPSEDPGRATDSAPAGAAQRDVADPRARLDDTSLPPALLTLSEAAPVLESGSNLLTLLMDRALATADARIGAVVRPVNSVEPVAAVGAHRFVATASVYKLAVLAVTVDEIENGRIDLDGTLLAQLDGVRESVLVALDDEDDLTVREALRRMIVVSDNDTARALLDGLTSTRINDRLRTWGIVEFSVGSVPQVATAHGVAQLLELIVGGDMFEPSSREYMLELLRSTDQSGRLPARIPAVGRIAHKVGDLEDVVNDAGIIPTLAAGDIIVVTMVEGTDDRAAAGEAIASTGLLVHSWFELYEPAARRVDSGRLEGCEVTPAATGPLTGSRIALDAAHGGADRGSIGVMGDGSHLAESTVNLAAVTELADGLAAEGATVLLTRCRNVGRSEVQRAALTNAWEADVLVSIDFNETSSTDVNLSSIRYLDPAAAPLATAVFGTDDEPGLLHDLNLDREVANAGIRPGNRPLLWFAAMPAIVSEPVSFSNPAEAAALGIEPASMNERLQTIVGAHVEGIRRFVTAAAESDHGEN